MNLEKAIEEFCAFFSQKELLKAAAELSACYQNKQAHQTNLHRAAYIATRLPATYAVLNKVFSEFEVPPTIIDCGAGPGTSIWALENKPITSLTLIEQDPGFTKIGKDLAPDVPFNTQWKTQSFFDLKESADLLLFSYSLNEIDQEKLSALIEKAYSATNNYIVIIEPGTPDGFDRIRRIRTQLLSLGMSLHAPCPHHNLCPMTGTDWCHFSVRLSRTSLHRTLKKGFLGHEDEKYSYLIASKKPFTPSGARVLRHPLIRKGHTLVRLCTSEGLKEKTITGKERKKLHWGDLLP